MKTPLKTITFFVVTLLIGIGIGFELSELILKRHFAQMQEWRRPEVFVKFYEDVIKPDETQKKILEPILLKYHKRLDSLMTTGFQSYAGTKDSLKSELFLHLTGEQRKNLEDKFREMEKH